MLQNVAFRLNHEIRKVLKNPSKLKCRQNIMPRKFCALNRSSHSEVLLGKDALKICGQFTGEHPSWNAISIKLLCNFIKITLRHGFSPVNLLHIFTTRFIKNTSRWLLLLKVSIEKGISSKDMFKISNIVEIQGQSECVTEKIFMLEKKWLKI